MLKDVKTLLTQVSPQIVASLQEPASEEKLAQLAGITGTSLPQGLVNLYREHNGTDPNQVTNFFYGYIFLEIDACIRQVQIYTDLSSSDELKNADSGIKTDYVFDPRRVPIGDDKGTSLICVDLDPAPKGTFGQVILLDYDYRVALLLAKSVEQLMKDFRKDLSKGKYRLNPDALEYGNYWLDTDRELDVGNWHRTQRWAYAKRWIDEP